MSPRTKLLNNKALADKVRDMVDGEVFDTAADAALLQYVSSLSIPLSIEQHAMNYAKVAGAMEFLTMFRRIADITKPTDVKGLPPNLDFKA